MKRLDVERDIIEEVVRSEIEGDRTTAHPALDARKK